MFKKLNLALREAPHLNQTKLRPDLSCDFITAAWREYLTSDRVDIIQYEMQGEVEEAQ